MKDFKKMPKMADGGSVFAEDMYSPQQVQDLFRKGHTVEKNISEKEAKEFDKALKIDRTKTSPARLSGSGGGGSSAGGTAADNKMLLNPRAMKSGGKVKRGNKK